MSDGLNDPYIIYITRGSPKLTQPEPEVANSPNDLYAVCMTKTSSDPFLGS